LTDAEFEAVFKVRDILNTKDTIQCTACEYCTAGCPMAIDIPSMFALSNRLASGEHGLRKEYRQLVENSGKASKCADCGGCEDACPQKLPIRKLLQRVAFEFE